MFLGYIGFYYSLLLEKIEKKIELQFASKFNISDLVCGHVFLVYLDETLLDKSRDCTAFSW